MNKTIANIIVNLLFIVLITTSYCMNLLYEKKDIDQLSLIFSDNFDSNELNRNLWIDTNPYIEIKSGYLKLSVCDVCGGNGFIRSKDYDVYQYKTIRIEKRIYVSGSKGRRFGINFNNNSQIQIHYGYNNSQNFIIDSWPKFNEEPYMRTLHTAVTNSWFEDAIEYDWESGIIRYDFGNDGEYDFTVQWEPYRNFKYLFGDASNVTSNNVQMWDYIKVYGKSSGTLPISPVGPDNEIYQVTQIIPELKQPWYFQAPNDIAVYNDNCFIVDNDNQRIVKMTLDGEVIAEFGKSTINDNDFENPTGIAIDSKGDIFITEKSNDRIYKFSQDFEIISKWGESGGNDGQISEPYCIAVDKNGNIFVGEHWRNHRVQKFSPDFSYITKWKYGYAYSIVFDINNNLYIGGESYSQDDIQKYSSDGILLDSFGSEFHNPKGIAIDNDVIYVCDTQNNCIRVLSTNGQLQRTFGSEGYQNGFFNGPIAIAIDNNKYLYIVDKNNNRIQKFSSEGIFISSWESSGTEPGYFYCPSGISEDISGNLFIADSKNNRIQQLSYTGEIVSELGQEGDGDGQFIFPTDVDIDRFGNMYVFDSGNHRIQKFDPQCSFLMKWSIPNIGMRYNGKFEISINDYIYVIDQMNSCVYQFDFLGNLINQWGEYGDNDGQFHNIRGIATDASGNVYVADTPNSIARIQVFDQNGVFYKKYIVLKLLTENDPDLSDINVDEYGNIYVIDSRNCRIKVFDKKGQFLTSFGNKGTYNGQYISPSSIEIGKFGRIYISDSSTNKVSILKNNSINKLSLLFFNNYNHEKNIYYFFTNDQSFSLIGEKKSNTQIIVGNQYIITKTHPDFSKKQWQYKPILKEGEQTFIFQAIDEAGNESLPVTAIVTLDTIPPEAIYTITPSGTLLYTTTVTIQIHSNDAVFYKYILDNQIESQEYPVSQHLVLKDLSINSEGIIHGLKLFARDASGNWQKNPQVFTWVNLIEPLSIKDIKISHNKKNNNYMIMQAETFCSDILIQGGKGPYSYTIVSNNLSETLSLTPSVMPTNKHVSITGAFYASGQQSLNVQVIDSENNTAVKSINVSVVSPLSFQNFSVLPPATTNTHFEPVQLIASGGCGQYSFSLINNQNDYIDLSDNILSITPTEIVDLDIPVRVTDSCSYFTEKHFMLRVRNPLTITTQRLHDGIVGKPYELHLSVEGGNDSYEWSVYDGVNPSEIQLHSQDGIYKGIPEKSIYGTIVFSVSDSDGRVTYKDYYIQIVNPLNFQTESLPMFEKEKYYEVKILAAGGIPPYSYKIAGSLENGLHFDNDIGLLSGVVTTSGDEHTIIVMAEDQCYPTHNVSIRQYTIYTAEGLSIISPQILPDICEGMQASQPLFTFSSIGGTWPLTWSIINGKLPQGVFLEKNSGKLSNFPQRHGTYHFTIQVQDALFNKHARECVWHITKKLEVQTLSTPKAPKNRWYTMILSASGGKQPYQWSVIHGHLPNGLSIDSVTGVISGIPVGDKRRWNEPPFIIEVRDSDSPQQIVQKEFTIEVTDQLYIYTCDLPQFKTELPYEIFIRGENGKQPYAWSLDSGILPHGLLLKENQNQAIISGIPQESGKFNFTIRLNDSDNNGPVYQAYTLTVIENVEIIKEQMYTAKRSEKYIYLLKARNGISPYIWNIKSGMLPKGLNMISISDNTYISGTVGSLAQTQSLILEVTDAYDSKAQWEILITVIDPFRISIDNNDSHKAVQHFPYQASFSLENGIQPYVWQMDNALPEGLSFTIIDEQGYIYGIPESCGNSTAQITVKDHSYPPDQRLFPFQLDIICQNDLWNDDLQGIPYPKGNIEGQIQSQGIYVSNAKLSITPYLSTVSDHVGNYSFIDINPGLYTITVLHDNYCTFQTTCHMLPQKKITIDINLFKTDGSALRLDMKRLPLAFKGEDYHERFIAKGGCQPYHFSLCNNLLPEGLNIDETGLFTGIPLISGSKELCIMVADSTDQSATSFVMLDILPNPLTITTLDLSCGVQGLYYRDQVNIENGFSPFQFTVSNGHLPDELSLSDTGIISGICQRVNPYHFEIEVTDNRNQTVYKQFDLNVTNPLVIQSPPSFNGIVGQLVDLQFNASGGCGSNEWHIFKDCLTSGLEISQNTGQLFGFPTQETFCTMVIHVNDTADHVAYKDFLINIVNPLKAYSTTLSPALKDHLYSEFIQIQGGQYPLSFTAINTLPAGLTLNENTGEISGIPENTGGFNFQVVIQDHSISNPQKVTQFFHLPVQSYLTVVTPSEFPESLIDSEINLTLHAKGGVEQFTWSIENGGLPGEIVLNNITGQISGKLTEWGSFTFTVFVTDASQKSAQKKFLWRIYNNLSIKNGYLADATNGVPYFHTFEADGGKKPYYWEITGGTANWPEALLFDSKTGIVSGTPVERMDYKIFGISVYDQSGQISSKDIGFSVNTMETFYITPSLPNGIVDSPYKQIITVRLPQPPFQWQYNYLPENFFAECRSNYCEINGLPQKSGKFSFNVYVHDSAANINFLKLDYSIDVKDKVEIITDLLPDAEKEKVYSKAFEVMGGTTPYTWKIIDGNLPDGLYFRNGIINGTITNKAHSEEFEIQVMDSEFSSVKQKRYVLFVVDDPEPIIITQDIRDIQQNDNVFIEIKGRGGKLPYKWNLVDGVLPQGLIFDSKTGVLSGIVKNCGNYEVRIRLTDNDNRTTVRMFNLSVICIDYQDVTPPDPPVIVNSIPLIKQISNGFISVQWAAGIDTQSGICGYSVLWDQFPQTQSHRYITSKSNIVSQVLANGMSHYVHIRSLDCAGNASETIHVGPFYVDNTELGDIFQDNKVDLKDTILALQIFSNMVPSHLYVNLNADVDGDKRITLIDCIYTIMYNNR